MSGIQLSGTGTHGSIPAAWVEGAARLLEHEGGTPPASVALLVPPDPQGIAFLLGAARVARRISPLHPGWALEEVGRALALLEPDVVVAGDSEALPELPGSVRVIRTGELIRGGSGSGGSPETFPPSEVQWVLWTSGSTGNPRGVVLTGESFVVSARSSALRLGLGSEDRWLASLSPAHVGGLALILRAHILKTSLSAVGPFDPERFSRAVDELGITHASLVPVQLRQVMEVRRGKRFPHGFRSLLLGGDAAPKGLLAEARDQGIPLALTWGMTEAASQVATAPPPLVREKPGTVGPPLNGVEVKVDETSGELFVRAPTLAAGLFRGPDSGLSPLPTSEDGWYPTGDVGRIDGEGHIWVTGRASSRIVTGGVTVDAGEVEAALSLDPRIREAVVVGWPDPRWGERVVAWVVPEEGESVPSLEDLQERLRTRLSAAKLPRELVTLRSFPRTATGKADRSRLGPLDPETRSGLRGHLP